LNISSAAWFTSKWVTKNSPLVFNIIERKDNYSIP
jgi:hypothetical protein